MKSNKCIPLLLATALAIFTVSCGQNENGNTIKEGTSSSQPESSVSQTSEESSSLPESTAQNFDPEESFDPAQTAAFEVIDGDLLDYVGYKTFEPWMQEMQKQHKAINIQSFVVHFQIDRATLESILPNTYTSEQLDALYNGDEEAILKAFQLPEGYIID